MDMVGRVNNRKIERRPAGDEHYRLRLVLDRPVNVWGSWAQSHMYFGTTQDLSLVRKNGNRTEGMNGSHGKMKRIEGNTGSRKVTSGT